MGALMSRLWSFAVAFLISVIGLPVSAHASRELKFNADAFRATAMAVADVALAPLAFVRFCMDHGRECEPVAQSVEVVALSGETLAALERVNREVNRLIRPVEKSDAGGYGRWAVNPPAGDCNDYAVSKRHELIKAGLPASALLLAVARTRWGEGHLLLIVRTDRGDLVLDNLAGSIRPWDQTDYTWIKRQSPIDPMRWESVSSDGNSARVAAAIQRSRDLARERAEKRREARLLLAEARRLPHAETPPSQTRLDMPANLSPVALGFEAIPAWAASSSPVDPVGELASAGSAQPRFVQAELAMEWQGASFAMASRKLSMALLTGGEWLRDRSPYEIALAPGD